ncbi:MAG: DUF3794 domain-containing protein [Clostridia bacterium]|nr:DUF3794 domain-containing protein [Clostridia bacterium]
MSVKPEFETYSYAGPVTRFKGQSIVECRLTGVGEIGSVLATRATAALTGAEAQDGEVRYNGKLLLGVVYEDGEKNVCRMERGAEFTHRALSEAVTPSHSVRVELTVLSATVRREGASFYVSCVVEADISVFGAQHFDYLTGGASLICQKSPIKTLREEYCSGQLETGDEFETDFVGDVLMHGESVYLQHVSCSAGSLVVSGEVAVNVCVLKDEGLDNYERLLPFRAELPCEAASTGMPCHARVCVQSSNISAHSDEDKGRSKLSVEVTLHVSGTVCVEESIVPVEDAFSPDYTLRLTREARTFESPKDTLRFTERVNGVASLSAPIDYSCTLQALVLQHAEADCRMSETGVEELQGVVSATLLVSESDGTHRSVGVQLPFALPLKTDLKGRKEVSVIVCGMSVRQKREGEAEVEATLKFAVDVFEAVEISVISALEEGERVIPSDCAFSVFLPREGDGLWEIAKSLHKAPEEVAASNPDMTFPVKKGERIIVYRQKT